MYAYTNRDVPFIRDHAAALAIHESITPLKSGPMKGHRPVGKRSKTYQRIWLDADGNVRVTSGWRDYMNVEIAFYKGGTITIACPSGHMGASTMGFVGTLLDIEINHRGNRLWIHGVTALKKRTRWDYAPDRVHGSFPLSKGFIVRLSREVKYPNELTLSDPIWPVIRTVNKANTRELRKQYAPFITYAKGVYGLMNEGFTDTMHTEYEVNALVRDDMAKLMASPEPNDNLRAAMWLAHANKSWRWFSRNGNTTNWQHTKERALADILRTIYDAHPGQAYDWTKREDGKVYTGPMKLSIER